MTNRHNHRNRYIEGWYELNGEKLLASVVSSFVFEDPREAHPINKEGLVDYMYRWNQWTSRLGASNQWQLQHEVRQDKDGIITDWEWWQLLDTPLCGMALVLTSDAGVLTEKITYFDRAKHIEYEQR